MSVAAPERPRAAETEPAPVVVAAPAEPATPPAPERDGGARGAAVRVAAVAALAAFAAGHWVALVGEPPGGRGALVALLAGVVAAAVAASARLPGPRAARSAARVAIVAAGLAAGLLAAGLEARLLAPAGWGELAAGVDEGLASLRDADWPYDGPDPWARLALLLGLPALAIPGAALACWPGRRAAAPVRALGAALLVAAYAVPVTNVDFDGDLGRGAVLAALLLAWLAPGRLARRGGGRAAATIAVAALAALPIALAVDGEEAWFDYKSWNWFGAASATTFEWDHSYGPLDWPRDGRTLLEVRSRRPLYWRVATLDRFDGFAWGGSRANADTLPGGELPLRRLERRWIAEDLNFTVRDLSTRQLPVAGTPLDVRATRGVHLTQDGTATTFGPPLREGDRYDVDAYVPDPSARRMRAAGELWPEQLRQYLRIELPRPGESALDGTGRAGDAARSAERPLAVPPFRGEPDRGSSAHELLASSPYAGTYRLARRLAAGQPTTYDVVKRIERHLRTSYAYNERPPSQEYPLEAFLFEDRRGYCQQFSGAMALMLRMNGIPARVAAGFSPGSYNRDRRTYRVRDLDAHSWVEAYFPRIGWVAFDPTASGAPAASRARPERAASAAGTPDADGRGGVAAERSDEAPALPSSPPGGDADGLPGWARLGLLLALGLAAGGGLWLRRRGQADPAALGDRAADELARALARLGFGVPAETTLLALERRLARVAGPAAAGYARRLRDHRYGAAGEPPGAPERRALRRELARLGGPRWRLRCLLALPPGGPLARRPQPPV